MSTIEVGKIYFSHNSADGVEIFHDYYNSSERVIKYITFTYVPYNAVNDVVKCTIKGRAEASGRLTGPISPNTKSRVSWENLWYNPTVCYVVITQIHVQYMDNTEEVIAGKDVLFMDDENSIYYNKIGRSEELQKKLQNSIAKIRKELQKNWSTSGKHTFPLELLSGLNQDKEAWSAAFDGVKWYYSTGYEIGDYIEKEYPSNEELMKKAIAFWKNSIEQQQLCYNTTFARKHPDFPQKYAEKIQKYDPSYVMPKANVSFIGKLIGIIITLIEKAIGNKED